MNNITFRLAWRNLWRRKRRTWLTVGAMVFSNILLVFMISLQIGMYGMMINNTLRAQTGHLQVQAPGYKDDHKIRQVVPGVQRLAEDLRQGLGFVRHVVTRHAQSVGGRHVRDVVQDVRVDGGAKVADDLGPVLVEALDELRHAAALRLGKRPGD